MHDGPGLVCPANLLVEAMQVSTPIGEVTQDEFWNIVAAFGNI